MSLIAELKRRNVFRVGAAYAIVAWLLVEVASVVLPTFEAPEWVMKVFTFLVILGFPLTLVIAWAFELTPEGIKRETAVDSDEPVTRTKGRKFDFAIIGLLLAAVVFLVVDNYVLEPEVGKDGAIRSIAVLPFNDLSPGDGRKLLADGIAEAIIHVLAQHQELLVTARTSSFYFRDKDVTAAEIGRALGVQALLEGSVQIADDRLRVNSQLIRTSDQTHIWSNVYEAPLGDIFQVQDTIANTVRNLVLDSGKSEMPTYAAERPKVEVYELVLEARHLLDEASVAATERAIRILRLAVDLSPNYADAHAWLGMALRYQLQQPALEVDYETGRPIREEWQTAVDTAVALDPNNAIAILQHGELSQKTGDGAGYASAAKKAIEVAPNDPRVLIWTAVLEAQHLNFDLAREYVRRARTVDPSDFSVLGSYIWRFCDFEEFASIVDAQLATYTTSTRTALEIRQQALFCDKRYSEAFATNVELAELDTEPDSALWALYTLAELGNHEALSLLDAVHKLVPGWFNNSTEDASIFFEEVVDQRRKTYQQHRQSEFFYPWFFLIAQAKLLIQTGDLQGAEHSLSRARELWENYYAFHDGRHIQYQTLAIYGYSAWLAARRGDTEAATKISRKLLSHLESRNLTEWSESRGELSELPLLVLTLNGKTEKAVEWIRLAAADNWLYFQPVLTSLVFADFREYPEVSEALSDLLENRKAVLADISTSGIPEAANPALLYDRIERLADISDYRRAQILAVFDGDLQGAAGVYLAAIKNNPEDVSGLNTVIRFAYRLGRTETASRLTELLVRANIEDASSHFQAAYSYLCLGRDDDAIESLRKSLAADPDWEGGHRWMAIALMFSGNELAAMKEVNLEQSEVERLIGEALVNYAMGNQHESDTALRKLIDDHGLRRAASIASIYAFRNEIDESFRWLDTHFETSQGPMYDLTSQPLFANLHNDPRWTELLKRLGRDPAEMAKIDFDFDVDSVLQER